MWREQVQVSVERNPYTTKKMTPKEIISNETIWIPILQILADTLEGEEKEKALKTVKAYKKWIAHEKTDAETLKNLDELRSWLGLPEWRD